MSLKAKLIAFCLIIGLVPLCLMGAFSINSASRALSEQAFGQLESVRDIKRKAVMDLVDKWRKEVRIFADTKEIYNALGMIGQFAMGLPKGERMDVKDPEFEEMYDYVKGAITPFVEVLGYADAILVNDYGRVLFTTARKSDLGQDLKDGPLKDSVLADVWQRALAGPVVFGDYTPYPPLGGKPAAFIAAPIHSHVGDIQGVAVLRLPLDEINGLMTLRSGMGQTGESYVVGRDLHMRSDSESDPAFHSVDTSFEHGERGKVDTEPARAALKGETGIMIASSYSGQSFLAAYTPIPVAEGAVWALISEVRESEAFHAVHRLRTAAFILGAATSVLVVLSTLIFLKRELISPLTRLRAFVSKIAQGDFQAELEGRFKSEMGTLSRDILTMVAELKNKLGFAQGILESLTVPCIVADPDNKVTFMNEPLRELLNCKKACGDQVGRPVHELLQRPHGERGIVEQCFERKQPILNVERRWTSRTGESLVVRIDAAPLYDLDRTAIGAIAQIVDLTEIREKEDRIREQNAAITSLAKEADAISEHVSEGAKSLSGQVEQVLGNARTQGDRIQETSTAIDEMNMTLLEAAKNANAAVGLASSARERAEEGTGIMERSNTAITRVRRLSEELRENMHALGGKADSIGGIISVISDIADQTNLLALNAAIEAARAGDAGRGFAVVADEVRKLAEKTMDATREVVQSVSAIQEAANHNTEATNKAAEAVNEAGDLVAESGIVLAEIARLSVKTADEIQRIAEVTEEQSAAHDEITRTVEDINLLARETEEEMERSSEALAALADTSAELKALIGRIGD